MIELKEPNPLNVFKSRRLQIPAPFLDVTEVSFAYNLEDAIVQWIENNCKGRYYVGKGLGTSVDNSTEICLRVGFEQPKETSYFIMACPLLKYK